MNEVEKTGSGRYEYESSRPMEGEGNRAVLDIQRAIPHEMRGGLAIRIRDPRSVTSYGDSGPRNSRFVWVPEEDIEKIIQALRDAAKQECKHCHGSGLA